MSDLQDALDRLNKSHSIAMLQSLDHAAMRTVMKAARKVANPDYQAAAKAMYDADDTYPESWGYQSADVCQWYRRMARLTVIAALGIGSEDTE